MTDGPSAPEPRPAWTIGLAASAAAVAWTVAHVIVQRPRGWPFYIPGEWDVLLVARAIEAGDPPAMVIGSLHGYQPGSWLIGGCG